MALMKASRAADREQIHLKDGLTDSSDTSISMGGWLTIKLGPVGIPPGHTN